MEAVYQVKGMTCQGCVRSVTRAIEQLGAGLEVEVKLEGGRVRVRGAHTEQALRDAVEGAGFEWAGAIS